LFTHLKIVTMVFKVLVLAALCSVPSNDQDTDVVLPVVLAKTMIAAPRITLVKPVSFLKVSTANLDLVNLDFALPPETAKQPRAPRAAQERNPPRERKPPPRNPHPRKPLPKERKLPKERSKVS